MRLSALHVSCACAFCDARVVNWLYELDVKEAHEDCTSQLVHFKWCDSAHETTNCS